MKAWSEDKIRMQMRGYLKRGASAFRRKQVNRLIAILDDISKHENHTNHAQFSKQAIIGYWKRHSNESHSVLKDKYQILVKYYDVASNRLFEVPKPNKLSS